MRQILGEQQKGIWWYLLCPVLELPTRGWGLELMTTSFFLPIFVRDSAK